LSGAALAALVKEAITAANANTAVNNLMTTSPPLVSHVRPRSQLTGRRRRADTSSKAAEVSPPESRGFFVVMLVGIGSIAILTGAVAQRFVAATS
jgi:hypothetical protein